MRPQLAIELDEHGARRAFHDDAFAHEDRFVGSRLDGLLLGHDVGQQVDRFDVASGPSHIRHGDDRRAARAERMRERDGAGAGEDGGWCAGGRELVRARRGAAGHLPVDEGIAIEVVLAKQCPRYVTEFLDAGRVERDSQLMDSRV